MPDIRIHREHRLGLAKARKIAWKWAEEVEQQFGMECSVLEGETSDTVEFTRSGVNGRLIVAADHFDLDAKLGFLLGAFSKTIESQIERNLDELLAAGGPPAKAAKRAVSKAPAKGADKGAEKGAAKGASKLAAKPAAGKGKSA